MSHVLPDRTAWQDPDGPSGVPLAALRAEGLVAGLGATAEAGKKGAERLGDKAFVRLVQKHLAGTPLYVVARLVGTSVQMVERHYAHCQPDAGAAYVDRVFG